MALELSSPHIPSQIQLTCQVQNFLLICHILLQAEIQRCSYVLFASHQLNHSSTKCFAINFWSVCMDIIVLVCDMLQKYILLRVYTYFLNFKDHIFGKIINLHGKRRDSWGPSNTFLYKWGCGRGLLVIFSFNSLRLKSWQPSTCNSTHMIKNEMCTAQLVTIGLCID